MPAELPVRWQTSRVRSRVSCASLVRDKFRAYAEQPYRGLLSCAPVPVSLSQPSTCFHWPIQQRGAYCKSFRRV
jgi:hypothetical protein